MTKDLLEAYRRMVLIREFETKVSGLYRDSEIPGFVHLSIGQEASAVGACWPLGPAPTGRCPGRLRPRSSSSR